MANRLSIGTAWTEAALFLRRARRVVSPVALGLIVLPAVALQLVQPSNPFDLSASSSNWRFVALVVLVLGLIGQMAIMRLAIGWSGSVGGAIGLAVRRVVPAVLAMLLFGVLVGIALMPVLLLSLLVTGTSTANSPAASAISLLVAVLLLLALPRVLMAPAVAVERSLNPWRLLRETLRTTRGNYWRLLGFFGLFLIGSVVFALAVSVVLGSLVTLLIGTPEPLTLPRLILALGGGLVQAAIASLSAAMTGRILVQLLGGSTSGT